MTLLLAALIGVMPAAIPSDAVIGAAAYYSPAYDNNPTAGWDAIIDAHIRYGHLPPDFARAPTGYYCVDPDVELGTTVFVTNAETGETIACQVVDVVAPQDLAHWRANVVVEMSWRAFVAVGADRDNRVVVTRDGSRGSPEIDAQSGDGDEAMMRHGRLAWYRIAQ